MKPQTLVILSLVLCIGFAQDYLNVAESARIRLSQNLWTPTIPDRFVGMTMGQLKQLVSVLPPQNLVKGGLRGSDDSSMYVVYSDEGIFAQPKSPQIVQAVSAPSNLTQGSGTLNLNFTNFNLSIPIPVINNTKPNNTKPTPTPVPTPNNTKPNNTKPTPTPTPTPNNTQNNTNNNTKPNPTPTPTPTPTPNNTQNNTNNNTKPTPTPTPTPTPNTTNNTQNNTQPVTPPTNFDSRTKWSGCVGAVRNQGSCGSCWAFATVEAFEDRLCVAGKVSPLVQRSTQYLLDCDTAQQGCNGGYPNSAWSFLVKNGAPSESCYSYQGAQKGCPSKCSNGSALTTTKALKVQTYSSIAAVKNDIYTNGPVETYFMVYQDFYYYSSGIYTPTSSSQVGYHAVKIIGWGNENGVDYWLVQNSWGATWGEKGFFRIKMGTCEFDNIDHIVAGTV